MAQPRLSFGNESVIMTMLVSEMHAAATPERARNARSTSKLGDSGRQTSETSIVATPAENSLFAPQIAARRISGTMAITDTSR